MRNENKKNEDWREKVSFSLRLTIAFIKKNY